GDENGRLCRRGLAQHRRGLLRDDAGAHPRPGGGPAGEEAPAAGFVPSAGGFGGGGGFSGGGEPPSPRRRADQCDRIAQISGADRRRSVRGGGGDRPPAGEGGRPDHRRLPGGSGPERAGGHGTFFAASGEKGESSPDDRFHRSGGDRRGSYLFPGEGDHQFNQSGGRRRAFRRGGTPHPPVRGGGGRRGDR